MSIIKVTPDMFETYQIIARPQKLYRSSSSGITGSITLIPDGSPAAKDLITGHPQYAARASLRRSQYSEQLSDALERLSKTNLMVAAHEWNQGLRYSKKQHITRTIPGNFLDEDYLKKMTIKNVLFPYYRNNFPSLEWGFTNYNCINFFEDDNFSTNAALIYPAVGTTGSGESNRYAPNTSFTFEFYIKPKESIKPSDANYIDAGTILHMSSCYAISLVTGSSRGPDGKPDKYRILLQLSQSADIAPERCVIGSNNSVTAVNSSADRALLFASTDNSLVKDKWNHVAIRWPGTSNNNGIGSFVINGIVDSNFEITSSTIMQDESPSPYGLFMGSYYDSSNQVQKFFNTNAASNEGLLMLTDSGLDPSPSTLVAPLRAELHEIRIYNEYRTLDQIRSNKNNGFRSLDENLLFYVPVHFVRDVRNRKILRNPYVQEKITQDANLPLTTSSLREPFNTYMSFGTRCIDMNIDNFVKDFVQNESPRLFNMTASAVTYNSVAHDEKTAYEVVYSGSLSAKRRLYTILPCDNGLFKPDFRLLSTGSHLGEEKFVNYLGERSYHLVSLENMTDLDSNRIETFRNAHEIIKNDNSGLNSPWKDRVGSTPEQHWLTPAIRSDWLSMLWRTADESSNEIVIFDVSNMFYGDSITPGTVIIEDLSPYGTTSTFKTTLRDNGLGSIYRADISDYSKAATWASVGNVLYDEGLIILKAPQLSLFGKEDFQISFKGNRTVHVNELTIPVERTLHNSSSNPTYQDLKPTDYSNETAQKFTYISNINLHDDNLNVVGKVALSNPFVKREEDRVVIKVRIDF